MIGTHEDPIMWAHMITSTTPRPRPGTAASWDRAAGAAQFNRPNLPSLKPGQLGWALGKLFGKPQEPSCTSVNDY